MRQPEGLWAALERLPFSRDLRTSEWLYPGVEVLHALAFTSLVGSIVLFDARLLGAARSLPVTVLGRYLRRWSLASAALVVPSGLLLFMSNAVQLAQSTVFGLKLAFILIGAGNALAFQLGVHRTVRSWDRDVSPPRLARLHGAFSIAAWSATITCGQWLPYA